MTTVATSTVTASGNSTPGYTMTQVYDQTTGMLVGLGNTNSQNASLASVLYNENALVGTINFATNTGNATVASEQFSYDGDLRPIETNATWQSGSGTSGTILDQQRRKNKREWEARLAPRLYVAFIDCKTSEFKHQDRYEWTGVDMEEIQLWPDIAPDDWIVTWEASDPANILLCPIHWDIALSSVVPTIIDTVTAPMTRMGPIVFVAATEQDIRVVHLQPILDDTSPPVALVSRVAKKHLGKSKLTGFMTSALEYLWPGGAIQVKRVDNDAFKAGAVVEGQAWYLITFDAEYNENEELLVELPEIGFSKVVQGKPYWRIAIAGGSLPMPKLTWKHPFHMRIPATAYPK